VSAFTAVKFDENDDDENRKMQKSKNAKTDKKDAKEILSLTAMIDFFHCYTYLTIEYVD
jgi:hypothetical protein|tara:strand:+ start:301 stop:477 length:177 start_codon:yes stop_codon:yes gene_type:complete